MPSEATSSHRHRIVELLAEQGIGRLSELLAAGVTASSVSRLEREGTIVRLARGLYQLADAPLDAHHALAEAAKRVPRGVVCLVSALAFHELTDRMPRRVWMAIGGKDWKPRDNHSQIRFVRFSAENLEAHIEVHSIEGVQVRITDPARTVVDLFKYRGTVGLDLALEGLKEVLRTRKASPARIQGVSASMNQWRIVRPYLEAMTLNG